MQINPVAQTDATNIVVRVDGRSATQTAPQSTQSNQSSSTTTDSVSISSAAQSALEAALQEATETPAQTAKEANSGDHQAQKLLAKEAAAKEAQES